MILFVAFVVLKDLGNAADPTKMLVIWNNAADIFLVPLLEIFFTFNLHNIPNTTSGPTHLIN